MALRRRTQGPSTPSEQIHPRLTGAPYPARMSKAENPFRYFNSSPEVIRLVVLMYVRFPTTTEQAEQFGRVAWAPSPRGSIWGA